MAGKVNKATLRQSPRGVPDADDVNRGLEAALCAGEALEETVFSEISVSVRRIGSIRDSQLLFERVSFAECEIGSANLFDTQFFGCDFSNAMLRNLEATRVEFVDCKLVGTNAFGCRMQDVLIDRCDASFAQFGEGRLRRCEIRASQFRESALNRMEFEGTRLHEVILRQADLGETSLAGLDLSTCEIDGIVLRIEDLHGAIVNAAQAMELARFLGVTIK
jgi:uncharacterized protein YjbI with pentapeptide repeats